MTVAPSPTHHEPAGDAAGDGGGRRAGDSAWLRAPVCRFAVHTPSRAQRLHRMCSDLIVQKQSCGFFVPSSKALSLALRPAGQGLSPLGSASARGQLCQGACPASPAT